MILVFAAVALLSTAAAAALAVLLRRERALCRAAEARVTQFAMLEQRIAAARPIEALAVAWRGGCRPPVEALDAALAALPEAGLLHGNAKADFDELEALLLDYCDHRRAADVACTSRFYVDRDELTEREVSLERVVRSALARVRQRLAEGCRQP